MLWQAKDNDTEYITLLSLRVVITYVIAVWCADIKEVPCAGLRFSEG